MQKSFLATNWALFACFVLSAVLQYNDPDPLQWIAIYGLAAAVCVGYAFRKPIAIPAGAALLTSLIWAGYIYSQTRGQLHPEQMFNDFHMTQPYVEEAREIGGLLIVSAWMAVLLVAERRRD